MGFKTLQLIQILHQLIMAVKDNNKNEVLRLIMQNTGMMVIVLFIIILLILCILSICFKFNTENKRKEKYTYRLISAVAKSDVKTVEFLLKKGADVNYRDFSAQTPLLIAVKNCDKIIISFLLEKGANIECIGENGRTPLLTAVENGSLDIVSLLLEKGADISSVDSSYRTALDLAIKNENADLILLLLKKGANIGSDDSSLKAALDFSIKNENEDLLSLFAKKAAYADFYCEGKPVLFFAIENNYKKLVELLIEKGVHRKSRYSSDIRKNMTPLFFAVSCRNKDMVSLLLKNKVDVDEGAKSKDQCYSYSPLYEAVVMNTKFTFITTKEIVSILIENGANINYDDGKGRTPLMGCMGVDKDMASFLIEKGADVNYTGSFAFSNEDKEYFIKGGIDARYVNSLSTCTTTPLSEAIVLNDEETVSFLIEKGADVNLTESTNTKDNKEYSETMLQKAIYNGNKKIISLVLDAGAKINDNCQNSGTALITAIDTKSYDPEIVSFLIERGADVNLESAFHGMTPLAFAVSQNNKDAVLLLLKNGADPNKESSNFGTPLGIAFKAVNKEMCSLLLENGANSDEALCISAGMPNTEVAQFFLDRGADVNCESYNALTPLQCAIAVGTKEMVLFLISNGADINYETSRNVSDKIGARTSLETAIETGNAEMVSLLITYGADVNHKCKNGNTPLLFAARHQRAELVPILKEAGAKNDAR